MTPLALDLLKTFEGFRPRPYGDVAGFQTIGFGHKILPGEDWSGGITVENGERLLVSDFSKHQGDVISLIPLNSPTPTEWELEAMTSLCFNVGAVRFGNSTLLRLYLGGYTRRAGLEFLKWVNAAGNQQPGLVKRRHIESIWFLGASPDTLMYYLRK